MNLEIFDAFGGVQTPPNSESAGYGPVVVDRKRSRSQVGDSVSLEIMKVCG